MLKYFLTFSSLVIALIFLSNGEASAQPKKGTDASYFGAGLTSGGQGNNTNTKLSLNAYQNSDTSAVSIINGAIGYRFK